MNPDSTEPAGALTRGLAWFVIGGAVIITVHLFRVSSSEPLLRWGPLLPMFAGAYAVVVGIEKMVTGFRSGRALGNPADRGRVRRTAILCAVCVAGSLGAGWGAWSYRAPYWNAISGLHEGDLAAARLKEIGERHVDGLADDSEGPGALEVWRRTSREAGALRPGFATALASARYLARSESGGMKARAQIDIGFYTLCLEWMDLFDRIQHAFETQSLAEPPLEWPLKYDDIIRRIRELETPGGGH